MGKTDSVSSVRISHTIHRQNFWQVSYLACARMTTAVRLHCTYLVSLSGVIKSFINMSRKFCQNC